LRTMGISELSELPELPDLSGGEGMIKLQEQIDQLRQKDEQMQLNELVTAEE